MCLSIFASCILEVGYGPQNYLLYYIVVIAANALKALVGKE